MKTQFDPILLELLRGETELPDDAVNVLRQSIESYRMGGDGFTFKEWSSFSAMTQEAFIAVGTKMRDQAAARIAYFMTQPLEMVRILFGEDAAIKFALENSMENATK